MTLYNKSPKIEYYVRRLNKKNGTWRPIASPIITFFHYMASLQSPCFSGHPLMLNRVNHQWKCLTKRYLQINSSGRSEQMSWQWTPHRVNIPPLGDVLLFCAYLQAPSYCQKPQKWPAFSRQKNRKPSKISLIASYLIWSFFFFKMRTFGWHTKKPNEHRADLQSDNMHR